MKIRLFIFASVLFIVTGCSNNHHSCWTEDQDSPPSEAFYPGEMVYKDTDVRSPVPARHYSNCMKPLHCDDQFHNDDTFYPNGTASFDTYHVHKGCVERSYSVSKHHHKWKAKRSRHCRMG